MTGRRQERRKEDGRGEEEQAGSEQNDLGKKLEIRKTESPNYCWAHSKGFDNRHLFLKREQVLFYKVVSFQNNSQA